MQKISFKYGFFHALLASGYIAVVALFLSNAQTIFGSGDKTVNAIAFLLTFVLSAAIMGITIFGRPILWYLAGKKREAILLVFYTIGSLLCITLIVFALLFINR